MEKKQKKEYYIMEGNEGQNIILMVLEGQVGI